MAEIWFYKPHNLIGRIVSAVTRGPFAHVGIMHVVADVAVMTEAHALKGVWCSALSRVRKPDEALSVDISDAWAAQWLIKKWGVRYGWLDALAFATPTNDEVDAKGVICTELIATFLEDAAADPSAKATIPAAWLAALKQNKPYARLSPSKLRVMLK